MDVIDEKWTADYDLEMIFEYFLPQLLKGGLISKSFSLCPKSPQKGNKSLFFMSVFSLGDCVEDFGTIFGRFEAK